MFVSFSFKVVHKCNEGARNEERREEMIQIVKMIAFLKVKVCNV